MADALTHKAPDQVLALNQRLEILSHETKADVISVIDSRAVGVVGSNWRSLHTFCRARSSPNSAAT